uniref:uncharacterized protein n=1 Tax=Myxine glutinosa TaxID=7769 RepID=UPI00358FA199
MAAQEQPTGEERRLGGGDARCILPASRQPVNHHQASARASTQDGHVPEARHLAAMSYRSYSVPAAEDSRTNRSPSQPPRPLVTTTLARHSSLPPFPPSPSPHRLPDGIATTRRGPRPTPPPRANTTHTVKAHHNYVDFYSAARPPYSTSSYEASQLHCADDSWV